MNHFESFWSIEIHVIKIGYKDLYNRAARHFAENHFAEMTLCRNDTLPKNVFGCDTLPNFFNSENLARPVRK